MDICSTNCKLLAWDKNSPYEILLIKFALNYPISFYYPITICFPSSSTNAFKILDGSKNLFLLIDINAKNFWIYLRRIKLFL